MRTLFGAAPAAIALAAVILPAVAGAQGYSRPPVPNAHALIMTIGDYQGGVPKLTGVTHDAATATQIARRLGVPEGNITAVKDGALTLEGMRKVLDNLESRLDGDSQVFIYYSGHGGRQRVEEDNGTERCAESLITYDAQGLTDSEMEQRLKRISTKAQKTIMFIDACHSGGVTTRSVGAKNAAYTPKSYTPPGQNCTKPTNVITRNIRLVTAAGSGSGNFVHIAAARDNEISLDQPGRGGVATQAWLACLSGTAVDRDGSGGLSADEIRNCAQTRIDDQLRNAAGFLPHHVSVNGNSNMVLGYSAQAAAAPAPVPPPSTPAKPPGPVAAPAAVPAPVTQAPAPVAAPAVAAPVLAVAAPSPAITAPPVAVPAKPAPTPAPAAAPPAAPAKPASAPSAAAPASAAPPTPAPPVALSPLATLNDIFNNRDDRMLVTVNAPRTQLRIGKDPLDFTVTSREGGYAYVLMVGSDGKAFDLLFPNQLDKDNLIAPGGSLRLPRSSWQISAEGPPGRNTLLVVVSEAPRDFASAGLRPSGPFSSAASLAAKDIQLVTAGAPAQADTECRNTQTRTLAIKKRCSTAYAAALLTIEEVR